MLDLSILNEFARRRLISYLNCRVYYYFPISYNHRHCREARSTTYVADERFLINHNTCMAFIEKSGWPISQNWSVSSTLMTCIQHNHKQKYRKKNKDMNANGKERDQQCSTPRWCINRVVYTRRRSTSTISCCKKVSLCAYGLGFSFEKYKTTAEKNKKETETDSNIESRKQNERRFHRPFKNEGQHSINNG